MVQGNSGGISRGRQVVSVCAGDVVLSIGDSASTLFGLTEASASGQCGPAAAGTAASQLLLSSSSSGGVRDSRQGNLRNFSHCEAVTTTMQRGRDFRSM